MAAAVIPTQVRSPNRRSHEHRYNTDAEFRHSCLSLDPPTPERLQHPTGRWDLENGSDPLQHSVAFPLALLPRCSASFPTADDLGQRTQQFLEVYGGCLPLEWAILLQAMLLCYSIAYHLYEGGVFTSSAKVASTPQLVRSMVGCSASFPHHGAYGACGVRASRSRCKKCPGQWCSASFPLHPRHKQHGWILELEQLVLYAMSGSLRARV